MAIYAYFCFRKFGMLPSMFDGLETNEKALVIAFIRKWAKDKDAQEKEIKRKTKR